MNDRQLNLGLLFNAPGNDPANLADIRTTPLMKG